MTNLNLVLQPQMDSRFGNITDSLKSHGCEFLLLAITQDSGPQVFSSPAFKGQEARLIPESMRIDAQNIANSYFAQLPDQGIGHYNGRVDFHPNTGGVKMECSSPMSSQMRMQLQSSGQMPLGTIKNNRKRKAGNGMEVAVSTTALDVRNEDEVTKWFEIRFGQIQQLGCKEIAKVLIRIVEPKKQSKYPYMTKKGDKRKPEWWPEDAEYIEPDHMKKPDRIKLLIALLRFNRLPISEYELSTREIFERKVSNEAEKEKLFKQKALLEEIYKVAKVERKWMYERKYEHVEVGISPEAVVNAKRLRLEDATKDAINMARRFGHHSPPPTPNSHSSPVIGHTFPFPQQPLNYIETISHPSPGPMEWSTGFYGNDNDRAPHNFAVETTSAPNGIGIYATTQETVYSTMITVDNPNQPTATAADFPVSYAVVHTPPRMYDQADDVMHSPYTMGP